ncbi:MAG TPA: YeeE/YedE family protein [Eubacteriaceae bacterium]|nr:YeeE/YedE family protein [Eubacteriaceae bacterium]
MPFNYKINQSQTIIGLIILALVVALGIYIGGKPAIFLFTGVALGYTLTRSRYGFAGGIKRIYITGEGSLSKALIVMFGITIVLSAIIHMSAAAKGAPIPGLSSVHFLNISTILGGFLFGIGMMIAGGCASGTLTDMGEGAIRAVIALIFFIIGTLPGLVIKGLLDNSALGKIGIKVYLPDVIGYIGSVLLSLLILFGLFILTKKYEAFRKKEGFYEELTYETIEKSLPKEEANIYHKVFVERWSFLKGGIILAILFAIIQLTTGHSWGITAGFTNWGVGFLQSLGVKFTSPAFQTTVNTVNNGLLKDTVGMRNLGILLGAAISFLLAGRFKFDFDFKVKDGLFYAFGGLLMGFGARLSGGCNVGALYSGIGNFSLAGWVYFIFLALGGIFALKVLAGKVNTVPPNRHDKKMV